MMGGGGGFLWFLIVAALVIVPFWRLLPRFGIPSWVALAAIIPFGAIVLLWVIAFRDELDGRGGVR
jgi:hypothetical protein